MDRRARRRRWRAPGRVLLEVRQRVPGILPHAAGIARNQVPVDARAGSRLQQALRPAPGRLRGLVRR